VRARAKNRKYEDSASVSVYCFIIACISAFMCVVWREVQVVTWQISPETFHASREGGGITQEDTMAWLRLVGSLKLQVSFTEYRLFYRALLQTRPTILRSLLTEATPYRCSAASKQVLLYNSTLMHREIDSSSCVRALICISNHQCVYLGSN